MSMRDILNINKGWLFLKQGKSESVDLPHTWNGSDGQDGGNDYYRGVCTYEKHISKDSLPKGDEVYIEICGANSSAVVYFNGKKLISHDGGYQTFRAKLSPVLDENTIKIEVDNSPNDRVYPQMADFTFYGGLYRDVSLIGVSKNRFSLDAFGSSGLFVTPKEKDGGYSVELRTLASGDVRFSVLDGEETVGEAAASGENPTAEIFIKDAHLWNGTLDPHLYTATASLFCDGEKTDEISVRFGCRSFKIDPEKGFILNGKEYPLRGVSRHQDRPVIGNALLYEHHKEDVDLICEMGANTVRLAHYQHSQDFYNLCDERGLVVWAEIPYISKHMQNGVENTKQQLAELIMQNYNHPSIVVWGLSNEITMNGSDSSVTENHRILQETAHSLDKTRLTTVAAVTMCKPDDPYLKISDVLSYNHYFGWYGGNVSMYGPWFDDFHKKYPDRAVGLSEYGAEALNWHTSAPEQGDYTEEYQAYYHEELIKQISKRPYLWATHVWNMFDFAADARAEGGENGMNHKGLVSFDRKYKKDSFYAYKAWLSKEPTLHICSKRYVDRVEDEVNIKVYSNADEVELFANGESVSKQKKGEYPFFSFTVKNAGETKLKAVGGGLCDESVIRKVEKFNESYRMKEEGAVINWFEIDTPTGYFSVNDTIGDILSTFKGKLFLVSMLLLIKKAFSSKPEEKKESSDESEKKKSAGMSVSGFSINKTMIELAKGFTVKRVFMMLGGRFTKEQILGVNRKLNKIKKPK